MSAMSRVRTVDEEPTAEVENVEHTTEPGAVIVNAPESKVGSIITMKKGKVELTVNDPIMKQTLKNMGYTEA